MPRDPAGWKPALRSPGVPPASRLSGTVQRVMSARRPGCVSANPGTGWKPVLREGPHAVADADGSGADDFSEHALAFVEHQLAQPGTNGVHFGAGSPRGVNAENGFADLEFVADHGLEIDAAGL